MNTPANQPPSIRSVSLDCLDGAATVEVLTDENVQQILPLVARLTTFPVTITDLSGRIAWVNEAFERLSGWGLSAVRGRHPRAFLHGALTDAETVALIDDHVRHRRGFQSEVLNYRADGTEFWISVDAQPILDEHGGFIGYLSIHTDISARKAAEHQVQLDHRLLDAINESLKLFFSSDDSRTAFDTLLQRLLDLTSSEFGVIGELQHDAAGRPSLKSLAQFGTSKAQSGPAQFQGDIQCEDEFGWLQALPGEVLTSGSVLISGPLRPESAPDRTEGMAPEIRSFLGLPIRSRGVLVGFAGLGNSSDPYSDATARFLEPLLNSCGQMIDAGRQRKEQNEVVRKLRETEVLLQEKGRIGQVGVWKLDVDKMSVTWSEETRRIHGVPADYVPDLNSAISFYAPHSRPLIAAAVEKGIGLGTPWDLELDFVSLDGRERVVRAIGHPTMENGRVVRLTGTFQDITDRRRAEQERERLKTQVLQSQKMESVGRLAGGIAHDFNNMLAVILGHAEMMLLDSSLTSRQREHLKAIQAAGQRSADLTHQLLAFARRQNAAPQKMNPNITVKRILELLRKSIGEGIQLEWYPGEEIWNISIDPVQLDQMLANLCMNAKEAIGSSGRILLSTRNEQVSETRRLRFGELPAGDYVLLTISDNGCGMSESAMGHLFEPFNTTKAVGQGPGLGLATVYGIVHQNGGQIDIESDLTIGTTFRIYFPRTGQDVSTVRSPSTESADRKKCSILLIEDEPAIVRIGKISLKQLGHRVFTAASGRDALQLLQSHGDMINVVITDIVLPGMSGWDLAALFRRSHSHIRFVFMSGYGPSTPLPEHLQDRKVPVLRKPFDLKDLESAIRNAIPVERLFPLPSSDTGNF